MKRNTKHKAAIKKRYENQTGGGPPFEDHDAGNDPLQNEVLEMINPIQIRGNDQVSETPVEFTFVNVSFVIVNF